jgi:hypothetical protein
MGHPGLSAMLRTLASVMGTTPQQSLVFWHPTERVLLYGGRAPHLVESLA